MVRCSPTSLNISEDEPADWAAAAAAVMTTNTTPNIHLSFPLLYVLCNVFTTSVQGERQ